MALGLAMGGVACGVLGYLADSELGDERAAYEALSKPTLAACNAAGERDNVMDPGSALYAQLSLASDFASSASEGLPVSATVEKPVQSSAAGSAAVSSSSVSRWLCLTYALALDGGLVSTTATLSIADLGWYGECKIP